MTPPAIPVRSFRFSREQYHRLGELGFFDAKRVELIRGEILEMSPINWPHQLGKIKLARALSSAFNGIGWVNEQGPLATGDSEPQPDVAVIPGHPEDYAEHPRTALLVVEVADTTLADDTTTKAELYATAGIADYWILDLNGASFTCSAIRNHYRTRSTPPRTAHTTCSSRRMLSPLAVSTAPIRVADLLP